MKTTVFGRVILSVIAIAISLVIVPVKVESQMSGYPLPVFELPYYSNTGPKWSGGPHQWDKGSETQFMDLYAGSGMDFAYGGQSFPVAAMAEGDVIWARMDNLQGNLGIQVAVKHTVGGSVIRYGHLSGIWQPILDAVAAGQIYHVLPGDRIGYAGDTGMITNPNIHLHIELRDGSRGCCLGTNDGGNPLSWHSLVVNGYRIYDYRPNELGIPPYCQPGGNCDPVAYNYDGVAVKEEGVHADWWPVAYENLSFRDWFTGPMRSGVYTYLPSNFVCDGVEPANSPYAGEDNCERSTPRDDVQFSGNGRLGGGGILVSDLTPPPSQPQPDDPTPTPIPQTGDSHVDLFENTNFGGTQYGWDNPTYGWVNVPDYLNNVASSIQLDGDWSIMVAQDPNGGGGRKCFVSSHTDLSSAYYDNGVAITDTISSVVVYNNGSCDGQYTGVSAGDQITMYVDITYTNTQYGVHDQVALNLPDYMTNKISSLGITSGWSMLAYDQNDGQGGAVCLTQSDPDLRDNYYDTGVVVHDSINSIRVFNNNNCSGWVSPLTATATPTQTTEPTQAAGPTQVPEPSGNLIANWSFENLTSGWADSWAKDAESISVDTNSQGTSGTNSLHFTQNSVDTHAFAAGVAVNPETTYQLGLSVKASGGAGEPGIYIDEYDDEWNWVSGQWLGAISSSYNGVLSFQYTPSVGVAYAAVQFYMTANTSIEVYIDSVSLVATASEPTAIPTFTETPTVTPTPVPTNLVANPGFEATDAGSGFATVWSRDSETVTVDTGSQGNEGTNSLHFAPHTAESHAFSSGFLVTFGANYTWSQYIKTTNAVGELGMFIDEYDVNGNWISGQWLTQVWENVNGIVSFNYTPSSASVTSAALQYVFAGNYTMEAWVDSVSLIQAN